MGEHGIYVWSTWGLTFVVIIGFIIHSVMQRRRLIKTLNIQQARQQQRQKSTRS